MFDLVSLVKTAGYIGLFGIIFAESGFFIGFFLPGDSLLFTAGFLATQGFLDIRLLITVTFLGAVLGDNFGYAFGKRVGPAIFTKKESLFFNKDYLERSRVFYQTHGRKTIVLARFLPFVRTFAPILAGAGGMRYKTFLTYNLLGGVLWAIGLPLLGFYLGKTVKDIDRYLIPIVALIVLVSVVPNMLYLIARRRRKKIASQNETVFREPR